MEISKERQSFYDTLKGYNEIIDELQKYPRVEGHIGKYFKTQQTLYDMLKKHKPKSILEIGTNGCHSACLFLNASPGVKIHTFDICKHEYVKPCVNILKDLDFDINLIEGDSRESVPQFFKKNDIYFDFIFIDGCHSGGGPYHDMINTKDRVKVGGLYVIDDIKMGDVRNGLRKCDWHNFEKIDTPEASAEGWGIELMRRMS